MGRGDGSESAARRVENRGERRAAASETSRPRPGWFPPRPSARTRSATTSRSVLAPPGRRGTSRPGTPSRPGGAERNRFARGGRRAREGPPESSTRSTPRRQGSGSDRRTRGSRPRTARAPRRSRPRHPRESRGRSASRSSSAWCSPSVTGDSHFLGGGTFLSSSASNASASFRCRNQSFFSTAALMILWAFSLAPRSARTLETK